MHTPMQHEHLRYSCNQQMEGGRKGGHEEEEEQKTMLSCPRISNNAIEVYNRLIFQKILI